MKIARADNQNGSTEEQWPAVPKIAPEQFQQSFAVAQLAIHLCGLKKDDLQKQWDAEDKNYKERSRRAVTDAEKEQLSKEREEQMKRRMKTLDAKAFLAEAWDLIESARVNHVLRPQTGLEYMIEQGGGQEAAVRVLDREYRESLIRFHELCDPNRNKGDTNTIKLPTLVRLDSQGSEIEPGKTIEVEWRVYRGEGGERAFDNLFWDYWNATSEIKDEEERKKYGESLLASWKRYGVAPIDFLAVARFRRERDNRAENLKKKPEGSVGSN